MNDTLVKVDNVSKKFCSELKRGLWYGLHDLGTELFGKNGIVRDLRKKEFWAVKDVSFELKRGECLGLIGQNGAGKSTLLKMLNGIIKPDRGRIEIWGRVGALIELGAGFNPVLTGRENIYINGSVLGFSKAEIDHKLDAIIEFAEIGDFIDTPVQYYSSGMKVRLGFAVASQMEPDVLLIDEVLAVGDLGFVLKCFNVIDNLLKNAALIFVSHNMPHVSKVCTNIIFLDRGKSLYQSGDVPTGIDKYYQQFSETNSEGQVVFSRNDDVVFLGGSIGENDIVNVKDPSFIQGVKRLDDLKINLIFKLRDVFHKPYLTIMIYDKEYRGVGLCNNENGINDNKIFKNEDGYNFYKVSVIIPRTNLSKGLYSVSFAVSELFREQVMFRINNIIKFQVFSKYEVWLPNELEADWK